MNENKRPRPTRTIVEDCWVCDGQKIVIGAARKKLRCGECNGTGEIQREV